jgi:hypothetical protein
MQLLCTTVLMIIQHSQPVMPAAEFVAALLNNILHISYKPLVKSQRLFYLLVNELKNRWHHGCVTPFNFSKCPGINAAETPG